MASKVPPPTGSPGGRKGKSTPEDPEWTRHALANLPTVEKRLIELWGWPKHKARKWIRARREEIKSGMSSQACSARMAELTLDEMRKTGASQAEIDRAMERALAGVDPNYLDASEEVRIQRRISNYIEMRLHFWDSPEGTFLGTESTPTGGAPTVEFGMRNILSAKAIVWTPTNIEVQATGTGIEVAPIATLVGKYASKDALLKRLATVEDAVLGEQPHNKEFRGA